jgi:hypothetical protein
MREGSMAGEDPTDSGEPGTPVAKEKPKEKQTLSRQLRLVGKNKKPPSGGAKQSTKNSHTSPRKIAARRKMTEAIGLREQGYSFQQIGEHLGVAPNTAHHWVVQLMREMPAETAEVLRTTELRRLDALFAAFYDDGLGGDLPAAAMALRISDQRARLCGLYPKDGQQLGLTVKSDAVDAISIEFVWPEPRTLDDELLEHRPARDVTPPQRTIDAPQSTIDATVNPPTSVPITGRKRGFGWT